jgi:8-oxo-dGTP diphosphatase
MIEIVTAVIQDQAGRVLLVRKCGTLAFMQPGGKREEGEDDLAEVDPDFGTRGLIGARLAPS